MTNVDIIEVHTDEYAEWVFDAKHPTQGRRFINAHNRMHELADESGVSIATFAPDRLPLEVMRAVHTDGHIQRVRDGYSDEWDGKRQDLGHLAALMCGGTWIAAHALLATEVNTGVHFAGAKHHAQADSSSGFCVFADFALAATLLTKFEDRRVAILDIDAHHGDGTENLTYANDRVLTFSIHQDMIFPGTGRYSAERWNVYNAPLEDGSGDVELLAHVDRFVQVARVFQADFLMVAMGADGLRADPLSGLRYTIQGLTEAVARVRQSWPTAPLLLGGAGGYQPDTETPEAWARMALAAVSG